MHDQMRRPALVAALVRICRDLRMVLKRWRLLLESGQCRVSQVGQMGQMQTTGLTRSHR